MDQCPQPWSAELVSHSPAILMWRAGYQAFEPSSLLQAYHPGPMPYILEIWWKGDLVLGPLSQILIGDVGAMHFATQDLGIRKNWQFPTRTFVASVTSVAKSLQHIRIRTYQEIPGHSAGPLRSTDTPWHHGFDGPLRSAPLPDQSNPGWRRSSNCCWPWQFRQSRGSRFWYQYQLPKKGYQIPCGHYVAWSSSFPARRQESLVCFFELHYSSYTEAKPCKHMRQHLWMLQETASQTQLRDMNLPSISVDSVDVGGALDKPLQPQETILIWSDGRRMSQASSKHGWHKIAEKLDTVIFNDFHRTISQYPNIDVVSCYIMLYHVISCYTVIKLLYVIIVILYNDILLRLCRDCSTSQHMQGRPCWPWRNPDLNGAASAGSTGWARALMGFRGPYLPQTWSNIQCITFEHHFAHQAMKYSNGIVDYFDLLTWISREDFCFPPLWHPDHKNCRKSFPRPAQLSILPALVFRWQSISQFASPNCIDSPEISWVLKIFAIEGSATTNGRASDWSQWSGHRPASPIWTHGCHSEAIDVGTQKAAKTCWKHAENGMIKFSNHSNWPYSHLDPQRCFNFRPQDLVDAKLLHQKQAKNPEIAPPVLGFPCTAWFCTYLRWLQYGIAHYSTIGCGNPEIHVDTTRNLVFSPEYRPWRE